MNNKENYLAIDYSLLGLTKYNNVKLSPVDKLLYSYFKSWSKTTNKIYPSLNTLSDVFGISVSTIQRSVETLINANMVSVSKENENKNSKTYYKVLSLNIHTDHNKNKTIDINVDSESDNIPF